MLNLMRKIKAAPDPEKIMATITEKPGLAFTFLNSFSYCVLRKNVLLKDFDYIYCDGILLSLLSSLFSLKKIKRVSFDMTSLFPLLAEYCCHNRLSIYFIGSTEHDIEAFCRKVKKRYPSLLIAGYSNGFFSKEEQEDVFRKIVESKADILVCGMGTGKQEEFILDIKKKAKSIKAFFTCGGFIHQGAKKLDYYPKLIDCFHLRWLYRLLFEPHTRMRFFKFYPLFLWYFFVDILFMQFRGKVLR